MHPRGSAVNVEEAGPPGDARGAPMRKNSKANQSAQVGLLQSRGVAPGGRRHATENIFGSGAPEITGASDAADHSNSATQQKKASTMQKKRGNLIHNAYTLDTQPRLTQRLRSLTHRNTRLHPAYTPQTHSLHTATQRTQRLHTLTHRFAILA